MMQKVIARRRGLSLLEILAAITLLGIVAAIVIPRLTGPARPARVNACEINKTNIEVQAQLWFRGKGGWPARDLGDIGADVDYFPDGLPVCPLDDGGYEFDAATQRVVGHQH